MRVVHALVLLSLLAGCASPPPGGDGSASSGGTSASPSTTATDPTTAPDGSPDANVTKAVAEWGQPDEKVLRPGINMAHDGAGCTTSFLFGHEGRVFMATAAHCVARGSPCDADRKMPAEKTTLYLTDGGEAEATVAYHSWTTMSRIQEEDGDACAGNDFALLEIAPADVALAHPASLHFRAPTALATSPTPDIWGFGASGLRQGFQDTHPKQGRHLGTAFGGWKHEVYLATPGIFGDSGGHIMTEDGKALGIASTINAVPPGANHYTDIAMALDYMREHEGWAPTIITWPDFNASLLG
jgi:hypothetical protein